MKVYWRDQWLEGETEERWQSYRSTCSTPYYVKQSINRAEFALMYYNNHQKKLRLCVYWNHL